MTSIYGIFDSAASHIIHVSLFHWRLVLQGRSDCLDACRQCLAGLTVRSTCQQMTRVNRHLWLLLRQTKTKIRWTMNISVREEKIAEEVQEWTWVKDVEEKLREAHLHWYGHAQRREEESLFSSSQANPLCGNGSGRRRMYTHLYDICIEPLMSHCSFLAIP